MTTTSLRRLLVSFGLAAAATLAAGRASAVTQSYCSFQAPLSTFTLNQNAFEALGSEIRLTDAIASETGSAWITAPISIAATTSFNAYFTFQMGPSAAGGDGLAFVLQNSTAGAAALGTGGLQMGYGGITPSVVIQFNTFKNSASDPNANNVSLMLNGSSTVFTATGTPSFTMAGGGILYAWVNYNGAAKTISVYISQTATKPAMPIFPAHALNLFTQLGAQMYVGFTSATGTSPEINEHDVLELELSTSGVPCDCEQDAACSGATPACASSGICAICSATNHTACTGATPICDVPTNACVGCLTDANCASPTPICDSTTLTCRACKTMSTDCSGATSECATTGPNSGDCVVCVANANCPPTTPRCTATNTCVQCLSAADCGGDTPVCNGGTCQACASDANCGGATPACEVWGACGQCSATNGSACMGGTSVCDFPSGTCVACEFNTDCSGATPTCDTTSHTCRACQTNADCTNNPAGPACDTTGMKAGSCVLCAVDADCTSMATPRCDTVSNTCVACLTSADCAVPTPVCNGANLCVGCLTSADCSTAMAPVCDPSSSQCEPCANDYAPLNPGSLPCPTAALPACQPVGSLLAGQCAVCSSSNDSLCTTVPATPVCVAASAACGCNVDTDCNPDSYCDTTTVATGTCTPGCRVMGGLDNCATGKYCTVQTGGVGTCMAEPCNQNSDCTAPNHVCDTIGEPHACVACLNDPDCTGGLVCDPMNHCVECTSTQKGNCNAAQAGAACLASEVCGCATDTDCGDATSGRVCDTTQHTCEAGCRGTGGNGCPSPETCSSTDGSVGQCEAPGMTTTTGAGGADGGATTGSGGGGGSSKSHVISDSVGCGCRVGDRGEARFGSLATLALAGLALARRRRSNAPGERTHRG
jgi:MYXO-CTERM domain-containing protein